MTVFRVTMALLMVCVSGTGALAQAPTRDATWHVDASRFEPLTEPPCSYCSTQHRKQFIELTDPVLCWIRGAHNGGAIPIRHFLSAPRVINDTYGLFFYDPDGGYVAAYQKDYGYTFYGWHRGVMIVKGRDGTLWSALTGKAIEGPQAGHTLTRIPNLTSQWGYWLMLHPESTAYDMFDGKRYPLAELPKQMSQEVQETMGDVDSRLEPLTLVMGLEGKTTQKAYPLSGLPERACMTDELDGEPIAVFWYAPTATGVAFRSTLEGRQLTFYADDVSPESAPFKDKETGSRWTVVGRSVDGPLKGKQLDWIDSIQSRWYAWAANYPETAIYATSK